MSQRNYNKRGKWYIYEKEDIDVVYGYLLSFYQDILQPKYGDAYICDLKYDKELQLIRYKRKRKGLNIFKRVEKIYLPYDKEIFKRIDLFLDTLLARGILVSPLYGFSISFKVKGYEGDGLLLEKRGKIDLEDFSYLKGSIY